MGERGEEEERSTRRNVEGRDEKTGDRNAH
jgi:hypothetical protein